MTDFKEQMIRNIERGYTTPSRAYDFTRDQLLDAADMARLRAKEGVAREQREHSSPLPTEGDKSRDEPPTTKEREE